MKPLVRGPGNKPYKFYGNKARETYLCHPEKIRPGSVVQLVRMLPCHGRGRGFESRPVRKNPPKWWVFSYIYGPFQDILALSRLLCPKTFIKKL